MKSLTTVLAELRQLELPAEYLLARLPVRKVTFAERCGADSAGDPRQLLHQENAWLYWQMNSELRALLAPVFFYFELPGLCAALRFKTAGDSVELEAVLRGSLLCRELKKLLQKDEDTLDTIREIAGRLTAVRKDYASLADAFQAGGFQALERALLAPYPALIRQGKYPAAIEAFLLRLIRGRDILTQAKQRYWHLEKSTPLLPDPEIWPGVVHRALGRRPLPDEPFRQDDPALLDAGMLRLLGKEYARQGQREAELPRILSHIWRCFLLARDCGLQRLAPLIGAERLHRELSA